MRDLGFDAVVTPEPRRSGPAGAAAARRPDDPSARRSGSPTRSRVEHSELRTTLLGSLLDAARYNLARGAERVALFESGRVYLRAGRARRRGARSAASSPAGARRPPSSRIASRRSRWARSRRRAGATSRGAPTSSRSRACSRRSPPSSAWRLEFEPERAAVPASRARGARVGRRRRGRDGSARSTRWSAASGTSMQAAGFQLRLAELARRLAATAGSSTRT